jgi:hypothetical protein
MLDFSRSMRAFTLAALALLSGGCTVVHGTGELLGIACEWVDWHHMDPTARNAPRASSAGPEDETCYLAWPEQHARVALASKGDDAGTVSCSEREDAEPTAEDPLVVRPGQIAWIFSPYDQEPEITLVVTTCAKLDAWTADGGTPGEFAADRLEKSSTSR